MCSDPTGTRSQFIIVARLLSLIAFAWERNVLRKERMLCFGAPGNLWCPKYQRVCSAFYKPAIFYNQFVFDGMLLKSSSRYGVVCVVFSWKAGLSRGGEPFALGSNNRAFPDQTSLFFSGLFHFCAYDEANIQCCNYSPATFHENKQEENAVKLIYIVILFVCLFVSRGNFVVYLLAAAA